MIKKGDKVLVTTDDWFLAPDGEEYRAVWGTVLAPENSEQVLGIKTNSRSTNWYLPVGNMVIAGCRIHYVIKCDEFSSIPPTREAEFEGEIKAGKSAISRIYNADEPR